MKINSIKSVTVIMPTFNEVGNIKDLIIQSIESIKRCGVDSIEIIVVDDDSPDRTWEVASQINSPDATIKIIRRQENPGLTNSLNEGIEQATKEVIVWLDCDFSHPPNKIPQLLFMLGQGYDVAVNSRYTIGAGEDREGKGGLMQLFLSRLLNWSIRFLLFPSFSDYTSGFVAVKRKVFDELKLQGDYGEYFVDFIFRILKKEKYLVCELPFVAPPRKTGESKTGNNIYDYFMRGRKYIFTVMKLRALSLLSKL